MYIVIQWEYKISNSWHNTLVWPLLVHDVPYMLLSAPTCLQGVIIKQRDNFILAVPFIFLSSKTIFIHLRNIYIFKLYHLNPSCQYHHLGHHINSITLWNAEPFEVSLFHLQVQETQWSRLLLCWRSIM